MATATIRDAWTRTIRLGDQVRSRLTFRSRLVLASAAAVSVAIVLASAVTYLVVRGQLRGEVDASLQAARNSVVKISTGPSGLIVPKVRRGKLGGPDFYAQVVDARGTVTVASRGNEPPGPPQLPVDPRTLSVAAGRLPEFFSDQRIQGTHVRVLTAPYTPGVAEQIARSMDEVDGTLRRLRLVLVLIAVGGVGLAAALGGAVARATLSPVRKLTDASEHVAATSDLSSRIEVTGSDELNRLAASFNTMLEALEKSLSAQRQLVADASHELRTPLTSLRTNIEVLQRGDVLAPGERAKLLDDVVEQIDGLSALVGDLVELARGNEPQLAAEDVRLDAVVAAAVERERKLAPGVRFSTQLEPAVVRAVPARLDRAVRNLLDNAAKWSPPEGQVEVGVRGGEVTVRDHGPGIAQSDLPHVFDRFYRAPGARRLPGSGLGLAIVKQVAESHGGSVSAEAAAGGGALFRLELPISAA